MGNEAEFLQRESKRTDRRLLRARDVFALVAIAILFCLSTQYMYAAFYIPSESMLPTLEVGDRVLVNKLIYRFTKPRRGDVVVFNGVVVDGRLEALIKRVVALPGDEVVVDRGRLLVNGERWEVPHDDHLPPDVSSFGPLRVPEQTVFVMGDNRGNSFDSRFFGPVPIENLEGKAYSTFWPPSHLISSTSKLAEDQLRKVKPP